ncbi:hypothetical protein TIFTF001_045846 [Ficus carica]|uniref:Uncharacterized protein n=1 Tax=Ficus carica TaxID=3494 RepID=A0AA87YXI9_FICCA|nr:hypothetical protein TIFTF001_045846 [Ficus carica]
MRSHREATAFAIAATSQCLFSQCQDLWTVMRGGDISILMRTYEIDQQTAQWRDLNVDIIVLLTGNQSTSRWSPIDY